MPGRSLVKIGVFLFLVSGLFQSLMNTGQEAAAQSLSSISGHVFIRKVSTYNVFPSIQSFEITVEIPVSGADVILIAGQDTLRTKTSSTGEFSFSGIAPSRVTLYLESRNADHEDFCYPFLGSFELMPGENIVIIPREQTTTALVMTLPLLSPSQAPVVTADGDTWIYHLPDQSVRKVDLVVEKLRGLPGVQYKSRKLQLLISGNAVRRTYVNGAYIFGLDPNYQRGRTK